MQNAKLLKAKRVECVSKTGSIHTGFNVMASLEINGIHGKENWGRNSERFPNASAEEFGVFWNSPVFSCVLDG